jgi:uncharacterized protein YdaT
MSKKQHVVPVGDKWGVKGEGNTRLTKIVDTQKEAINRAIPIAKNEKSSVVIHRPNGQIRDADSYGDESSKKDTKH